MILHTHAQRLERWLGADKVDEISKAMLLWPGPPIAIAGVPGAVWAMPGGDFKGRIGSGQFLSAVDFATSRLARIMRDSALRQRAVCNAGFSGIADIVAESEAGKDQVMPFLKTGFTDAIVVPTCTDMFLAGNLPAAGANAPAAPGGRAPDDTTTGALAFKNPSVAGDTTHLVGAQLRCDRAINTLLVYDRIFDVAKTVSSTTTEAVTGVPTRYQSTTPGDMDYAGGNFLFVGVGSAADLSATAHNWTVCKYTNQAGTTDVTLPSLTGNSGAFGGQLDHPTGQWFAPLASNDFGIKSLTQMQCSASVTGGVNFVIGHPLAFLPCLLANRVCVFDGLLTAFNLVRVFDDACITFMEVCRTATASITWSGHLRTVAG